MKTEVLDCPKCRGDGFIPGFAHISEGICFQCKGSGKITYRPTSITFAETFVRQYMQDGYFHKDDNMELVSVLDWGGQTAELQLLKDNKFYYIGQPVCHASSWYKVLSSEWDGFCKMWIIARSKKRHHLGGFTNYLKQTV